MLYGLTFHVEVWKVFDDICTKNEKASIRDITDEMTTKHGFKLDRGGERNLYNRVRNALKNWEADNYIASEQTIHKNVITIFYKKLKNLL